MLKFINCKKFMYATMISGSIGKLVRYHPQNQLLTCHMEENRFKWKNKMDWMNFADLLSKLSMAVITILIYNIQGK